MGKQEVGDSLNPRRSSGRVRKPTYKLRGDNGIKELYSSLTKQNSNLVKDSLSDPKVSEAKLHSKNSENIPKAQKINSDLDACREGSSRKFTDDDGIRNDDKVTILPCEKLQKRKSLKTHKYIRKKSMKSEETTNVALDISKPQGIGIKEDECIANEDKEACNVLNRETEVGNCRRIADTSSLENHCNTNISDTVIERCDDNDCSNLNVVVKIESGRSDVSEVDKYTNTYYESEEMDLKCIRTSHTDDIGLERHGLKPDGSATEFDDSSKTVMLCTVCSKSFRSRHNLNKHMLLHADKKPFQCEICGLSFALKNYLTTHKLVHNGVRSHKCDICGKQFLRRTNLNSHKKTHSDSKAFPCDICNKNFKTKFGRDCHRKSQHIGGFVCPTCGKSYSQQTYLRKHLSIHAGEKPYECTKCGKCFPYNQSLQEHMRRHLGEKPEVCDQCGKRFNNKRELKHHSKYHESTASHACSECNVRYESLQSLNKHMSKTHKKTHNCIHCNESFLNKKHLRSHVFRQHRDLNGHRLLDMDLAKVKKVECSFCQKVFFNRYVLSKHLVSMHQLSESDVKAMLQIRKKAASKPVSERMLGDDMNKDFSVSLENDKSFQVYYKDDEMAVYVKRVDDLDGKIKHEKDASQKEKQVIGNLDDMEGRYIVVEEENIVENELAEIDFTIMENEKMTEDVNNSSVVGMTMVSNAANPELVQAECVTDEHGNENSYVVISDHNEHSKELENQVVGEAEMYEISNNGSERIVLILNEASGESEIIFDGSEQYEIVESEAEIASANQNKEMIEMEMGNSSNVSNDFEIVANTPMISHEFPEVVLSKVSDDREGVAITDGNINKVINESSETNAEESSDLQKRVPTHLQFVEAGSLSIVEQSDYEKLKSSLRKSCDTIQTSHHGNSSENVAMETYEPYLGIMPNNNSVEEFSKFENALKTKVVDFQNNSEYVAFLDKMIQSIQNAKHTSFQ